MSLLGNNPFAEEEPNLEVEETTEESTPVEEEGEAVVVDDETTKEEGEAPEVTEEANTTEEPKESISNFDIALDNKLIEDLEAKTTSIAEDVLKQYGFKDIEELEAQGDGGKQIADIIRIAEEKTEALKLSVNELKVLRDNPQVKAAIVTQEITKVFNDNRETWLAELAEDNPELLKKTQSLPKKVAAEVAPKLDALIGEYAMKKRAAGKQIINPYLALQSKIESIISEHSAKPQQSKKKTPNEKEPKSVDLEEQKRVASLKGSGTDNPAVKTDPRYANLPKYKAQGRMALAHLRESLKIED